MKLKLSIIFFLAMVCQSFAQNKQFKVHTVAFYNLENLFDTIRDERIYDEEFTPIGARKWNTRKYNQKLKNLSKVIAEIGTDENANMPTILGVCEIENRRVLEDLVAQPILQKGDYGIVHFDSPDKRGIDVGLLYQKKYFMPMNAVSVPLYIYDKDDPATANDNNGKGKRVYTRDQLVITGLLDGEEFTFIVNHWPSRSGGEAKSSPKREAAGALNKKIIDSLYAINPNAKIVTMGDLNDGVYNKSVKEVLGAKDKKESVKALELYNTMYPLYKEGAGTIAYRDAWDIFDQLIISEPLLQKDYASYRFWKTNIYKKPFMIETKGQYKGYPLRNATSGEPGFSDHFPVYLYLIKQWN